MSRAVCEVIFVRREERGGRDAIGSDDVVMVLTWFLPLGNVGAVHDQAILDG